MITEIIAIAVAAIIMTSVIYFDQTGLLSKQLEVKTFSLHQASNTSTESIIFSNSSQTLVSNKNLVDAIGIAYDSANNFLYIGDNGDLYSKGVQWYLTAINGDGQIVGRINTTLSPIFVSYDPYWNSLIVSNHSNSEILNLSGTSSSYVLNSYVEAFDTLNGNLYGVIGNNVTVLSGRNFSMISTINISGGINDMAFDPALRDLVVGNNATLTLVGDKNNDVVKRIDLSGYNFSGHFPEGMAFDLFGQDVFLTGPGVTKLNLSTGAVEWSAQSRDFIGGQGELAFDSADNLIYVGHPYSSGVSILQNSDGRFISNLYVSQGTLVSQSVAYDPVTEGIYCVLLNYGTQPWTTLVEIIHFNYTLVSPDVPPIFMDYYASFLVIVLFAPISAVVYFLYKHRRDFHATKTK